MKQTEFLTNTVVALTVNRTSDAHEVSTVGAPAAIAGV
jgi:hypothetical protein